MESITAHTQMFMWLYKNFYTLDVIFHFLVHSKTLWQKCHAVMNILYNLQHIEDGFRNTFESNQEKRNFSLVQFLVVSSEKNQEIRLFQNKTFPSVSFPINHDNLIYQNLAVNTAGKTLLNKIKQIVLGVSQTQLYIH